ncbi:hypothetical protein ADEAN_000519500 [Angomonas deanei]|uniref:Mitotic-spindle organizing gamma-tubulin ring associated n=1 Tax=Angomonas deanei TaxID=59799 RepID=A0A7G2CEC4_9TRYP|nr:hypothetical protein ADEAN_000519500 [Angomonas deanei]
MNHPTEGKEALTAAQLELLAGVSYLLRSPLQKQDAHSGVSTSLVMVHDLLERGVDVERVVQLVQASQAP